MPVQRQISQPSQQSTQQKFYVAKSTPTSSSNNVKVQQSIPQRIYVAPKTVYVSTSNVQEEHELDDLSHLE